MYQIKKLEWSKEPTLVFWDMECEAIKGVIADGHSNTQYCSCDNVILYRRTAIYCWEALKGISPQLHFERDIQKYLNVPKQEDLT